MNFNKETYCTQEGNALIFFPFNWIECDGALAGKHSIQTHRSQRKQKYDGFLYQCRVSPKISARVGGNRNGKSNGFRFARAESFPGNEIVVDLSNQPRVPVLNARTRKGSKASINLTRRISTRTYFERGEGFSVSCQIVRLCERDKYGEKLRSK